MTVTATELYTGNYGIMDTDGHIIEPADLRIFRIQTTPETIWSTLLTSPAASTHRKPATAY